VELHEISTQLSENKKMDLFNDYLQLKEIADYFEDKLTGCYSNRAELIEFVKDYLKSFDVAVIGATGANSNQVMDFIKEMDADPDSVYYICYLIINTLRVASLKALRECAIEKSEQFS
jgi:hypothetical protein